MPAYYPAFIDVRDRACVVIGGGGIGEEKVFKLLECNARVRVISPEINDGVQELVDGDRVTWVRREYRQGDLEGAFIAIAAINDNGANKQIAQEAEQRNVLLNVVDVTHLCTFIAPSVVRVGDVAIAASTGGASPALARKLREVLSGSPIESSHGVMDYAELAPLLADVRSQIRRSNIRLNPDHWQACITDSLVDMMKSGSLDDAREALLADLMIGATCDCENGVCKMWEDKKGRASQQPLIG